MMDRLLKRLLLLALVITAAPAAGQPEVFIRASQLGYLPADPKVATIFGSGPLPAAVEVVATDGRVRLRADVTPRQG